MLKHLSGRKRWLRRQDLLATERERRGLARRGKHYDARKFLPHEPRVNERFRLTPPKAGTKVVKAPTHLDFNAHLTETLAFLTSVRNESLYGDGSVVLMDMNALQEISPEAALVLLAEISRCLQYAGSRHLKGNYPKGERASKMLGDIGFYRAFNIRTPDIQLPVNSRIYFRAVSGNSSEGKLAAPLMRMFEHVAGLDSLVSKKLYGALIECMDNVKAHAYPRSMASRPELIGEWWMAGFADPAKGQLAFAFFDQGVGIPTTIKEKRGIRFKSYFSFSDSRILGKAVMDGLSRKKSKRRGNGLPSLREFVEVAPEGFLRVVSNKGDFTYKKGRNTRLQTLNTAIDGSLVIWTIQRDPVQSPSSVSPDLSEQQTPQLELTYG